MSSSGDEDAEGLRIFHEVTEQTPAAGDAHVEFDQIRHSFDLLPSPVFVVWTKGHDVEQVVACVQRVFDVAVVGLTTVGVVLPVLNEVTMNRCIHAETHLTPLLLQLLLVVVEFDHALRPHCRRQLMLHRGTRRLDVGRRQADELEILELDADLPQHLLDALDLVGVRHGPRVTAHDRFVHRTRCAERTRHHLIGDGVAPDPTHLVPSVPSFRLDVILSVLRADLALEALQVLFHSLLGHKNSVLPGVEPTG